MRSCPSKPKQIGSSLSHYIYLYIYINERENEKKMKIWEKKVRKCRKQINK